MPVIACLVEYANHAKYKVTPSEELRNTHIDLYTKRSADSDHNFHLHKTLPEFAPVKDIIEAKEKQAKKVAPRSDPDEEILKQLLSVESRKKSVSPAAPAMATGKSKASGDTENRYAGFILSDEEDEDIQDYAGADTVDHVDNNKGLAHQDIKQLVVAPAVAAPRPPQARAEAPVKTETGMVTARTAPAIPTMKTAAAPTKSVAQQFKSAVAEKVVTEVNVLYNENDELKPAAAATVAVAAPKIDMRQANAKENVKEVAKTKKEAKMKTRVMTLDDLMVECETQQCWASREQLRKIKTFCDLVGFNPKAKFTEGPVYGCKMVADANPKEVENVELEEVNGRGHLERTGQV